jgi:cell wall assembly regulator SMI1
MKQKQQAYLFPKILRPPADQQTIERIENMLGYKFNKELKELYFIADGTDTDNITPIGKTGLIPIHSFLSLEQAVEHYKLSVQFPDSFVNLKTNYEPGMKLFPFLYDNAGNYYWVDLNDNSENYGKIFWTNTFGEDPDYEYSSLTNFFQVICEGYEKGIIFTDNDGHLDCDYKLFEQIKNNYNRT